MKNRKKNELARSVFHVCSGVTIVLLYGLTGISKNWTLIILGIVVIFLLLGDIFRQFVPPINHITKKVFKTLMRKNEEKTLAGSSYYLVGCWVAIFAFSKPVACSCILFLAIGDTLTKLVRELTGAQKTPRGFLQAFVTNFTASFLIAWFMLTASGDLEPLLPSILGATGASAGELVPKVDNLTIPLFGGILLSVGLHIIQ